MASSPVVAPVPPAERPAVPAPDQPSRWPRRLLVVLNVFVAMCLLAAGGVFGYTNYRFGQIHRIGVGDLVGGGADPGKPQTILVVGSDSRANTQNPQDKQAFGTGQEVAGQRSDTIILVRVDPKAGKASLMSIPRDLFVAIPGTNHRDRINSTFDKGPELLVQTIHDALGIEVNHYVEVDFNSFRGIVNSVGGVKVYFPTPARDHYSGLNITVPGCTTLNGDIALDYVRARHLQYYERGRWNVEGESDLARIRRQQDFIRRMMSKAVSQGLTNPLKLNSVVGSLASNLTVDSSFSKTDMVKLAKRFRNFSGDQLPSTTLPVNPTVIGGADVLELKQPDAHQVIDTFLGTTDQGGPTTTTAPVPNVDPATIRVRVLNGSGRPGQATSVSRSLRQSGLVVTSAANARSRGYVTPEIRFANGQEDKARYLQSLVIGGATLVADPTLVDGDVELITGSAYVGLHPAGGTTAATTPTTTAPAAPTTVKPALPGGQPGVPPPPCG